MAQSQNAKKYNLQITNHNENKIPVTDNKQWRLKRDISPLVSVFDWLID